MMAASYEFPTAELDKVYTKSLAEVGLLVTRYSVGCSKGIFLGGHYAVTPKAVLHSGGKGTVKRCEYFIKCCNCSELLAARDFAEHTGGKTSDWRSSLRVFEENSHPRLKDWVEERCKAPDAGHPGVGSRICIFWPTERNWFSGHVAAFADSEGLSKIQYDDGDTEWLHLAVECYMQPPTSSTKVAGKGQLVPFVEGVIDLCSSDSEEEILAQQLTGQRSNSSVLVKHDPLLIKPEPGMASSLQLQTAQPSQAGRSTGLPQPTHPSQQPQSVQSSTPRCSLQPSASSLSACPSKHALSALTAKALRSIPISGQAPVQGGSSSLTHKPKPEQRKRSREDIELQPHPPLTAVLHTPSLPQPLPLLQQPAPTSVPPLQPAVKQSDAHLQQRTAPLPPLIPPLNRSQSSNQPSKRLSLHHPKSSLQLLAFDIQKHKFTTASMLQPSSSAGQQQRQIAASMLTADQGSKQKPLPMLQLPTDTSRQIQAASSSNRDDLGLILQRFALGVSLDARNLQDALEELVCHLTDAVTNAKFFAILDRLSRSDAKESLVRYHGRVSALVEKHQLGGYDEVARVLQTYLTNLCN
ncbi:hypothetical protein WJX77_001995 [Trebouxia sp. C0004]